MTWKLKDPAAVIDYLRDWSEWLGEDTILTSTWIAPAGITVEDDTHTTTTATVWLSGGDVGLSYEVTNRVTTAGGRTDDRTMTIVVRER